MTIIHYGIFYDICQLKYADWHWLSTISINLYRLLIGAKSESAKKLYVGQISASCTANSNKSEISCFGFTQNTTLFGFLLEWLDYTSKINSKCDRTLKTKHDLLDLFLKMVLLGTVHWMVLPWHPFMCKSLHTVDAVLPQFFIETALIQDKLGGVVLWQIPKAVQLIELNWRAVVHWQARTHCICNRRRITFD